MVSIRNILLLSVLALASAQLCQPNNQLDGLESATLEIARANQNSSKSDSAQLRTYSVVFSRKHIDFPQVVVGKRYHYKALTGFEALPTTCLSFFISCLKTNSSETTLAITSTSNDTSWKVLRLNLFVNSRSDIEVATCKLSGTAQYYSGIKQVAALAIGLGIKLTNSESQIARAFITGISAVSLNSSIVVSLGGEYLNASHLTVQVQAQCSLDTLQVSYIIYSSVLKGASHTYTIQLNGLPSLSYISIQQQKVSSMRHYLYGIVGFQAKVNPTTNVQLSLLVDDSFLLEVKSLSVASGYIAVVLLGRSPFQVCQACVGKLPFYNYGCQDRCTSDQASITYNDGSQGCVICHILDNFVLSQGKCQCRDGYSLSGSRCQAINGSYTATVNLNTQTQLDIDGLPTEQQDESQRTSPNSQLRIISIGLIEGRRRRSKDNIPLKPIFGLPTQQQQQAAAQPIQQSEQVILPVVTSTSQANQQQSVSRSVVIVQNCTDIHSYWMGSRCVCQPTFYNISGICQTCPPSTYWAGDTCAQYLTGSQTIPQQITVTGSLFAAANPSDLNQARQQQNIYAISQPSSPSQQPVLPPITSPLVCPPDRILTGPYCTCMPGTFEDHGKCMLQTSQYQHEDYLHEEAEEIHRNYYYSEVIVQQSSPFRDPVVPSIAPVTPSVPSAQIISSPSVLPSNTDPTPAPVSQSSPAVPTSIIVSPSLPQSITPSPVTTPVLPYQPQDTHNNGNVVTLTDDSYDQYKSKRRHKGEPDAQKNCGPNGKWTPRGCRCSKGYFRIHGYCKKCPENTKSFKGTCICPAGSIFNMTRSECISCPDGTYESNGNCYSCPYRSKFDPKSKRCICDDDRYIFKDDSCVPNRPNPSEPSKCQNGIIVNGMCIPCQQNSHPYRNICVCDTGYSQSSSTPLCLKITVCPNHSSLDNEGKCICHPGYYNDRDSCSQCPDPHSTCSSFSNCTGCLDGYFMVNGQCISSACPVGQYLAKPGCTNCLKWCENCTGPSDCSKCTSGFEWNSTCNQCEEICGDGRKFVLACDDGNLKDGDGCSSKCTIEPGYMCVGGGPYSPDMCFCPEASKNGKPAGSNTQPLALSLKTPPKTTVSNCVFTITVLPEIKTYNDDSKGNPALIAAKSRSMIKMSFLGDKIIKLSGSCSQQPRALDTWTCTVSYDNQPPSSMFAVVLLATTTDGRTASMNVVVQPPKHS